MRKRADRRKHHVIYKTTCVPTGRYYIGMHSTDDLQDGYVGSGKRLHHSINKHGAENHRFEILERCETREQLRKREAELVDHSRLEDPLCMNLKLGGEGGWDNVPRAYYSSEAFKGAQRRGGLGRKKLLASNPLLYAQQRERGIQTLSSLKAKANAVKALKSRKGTHYMPSEAKKRIGAANSVHQRGSGNSQYGTMWVTDGYENKKVPTGSLLQPGWKPGRKLRSS